MTDLVQDMFWNPTSSLHCQRRCDNDCHILYNCIFMNINNSVFQNAVIMGHIIFGRPEMREGLIGAQHTS